MCAEKGTCRLITTVLSGKYDKHGAIPYGRKGEVVKIISVSGDVLIVEGPDGDRYPIMKNDIDTF